MTDRNSSTGLAIIMLILTPLFWAGHTVVGRLVANEIPTFSLVSSRWWAACMIIMIFLWPRVWAERWLLVKHWRYVLLTGLVGPVLFPSLLYTGLKTTTVTNTSIIQTSVPGLVPFIAWILLRERVFLQQIIGIAISATGVALIITQGDLMNLATIRFVPGDLIILCSFIAWSMYTVMIRLKPAAMHANTLLASSMLIGAFASTPMWIWEAANGHMIPLTSNAMWALGYIIIFPTLLSYYLYNHAIRIVGPTKAGLASHLMPPFGILLSVIFLDETLHLYHIVSFAVILSGVILVIRGGRASDKPAPG